MHALKRITLIADGGAERARNWTPSGSTIAFVNRLPALKAALACAFEDVMLDVARVIVADGSGADAYLELLASLPAEFTGDVVMLRDDGSGYLSATGRGAGRVLYALSASDVTFYLQMQSLAASPDAALLLTA